MTSIRPLRLAVPLLLALTATLAPGAAAGADAAGATTASASASPPAGGTAPAIPPDAVQATIAELTARYPGDAGEIARGVRQVAERWWASDGDAAEFRAFCLESYIEPKLNRRIGETFARRDALLRIQSVLEGIDGRLHEIRRDVTEPLDLDTGEVGALDQRLADLDLGAHVEDDLFATKAAFVVLLNFPVRTFEDTVRTAAGWDRFDWVEARLTERFAARVPARVQLAETAAFTAADQYIARYNVRMDRLVDERGNRPFPEGLRLITHWGLRDELASHYAEPDGLAKQRMIARVMERIVRQEIPAAVIDNPDLLWDPFANTVRGLDAAHPAPADAAAREPDTRYQRLLDVFHAVRAADPYDPAAPTFIARKFERERQMSEDEVRRLLVSVLESPQVGRLAREIRRRLGRPLEPFDIWYSGFKSRGRYSEAELDAATRRRYPSVSAVQKDLPRILTALGFDPQRAEWLAGKIVVDPARGAGHAMGAEWKRDDAHLRTRVGANGMDYKGYNIAIHELGHNVEQTFSLQEVDQWLLHGVPNTAFTEALAFTFQRRDMQVLGLDAGNRADDEALADLWGCYEIAGVALVDMGVWHWMYDHPQATAAELREATLGIAREVWNRWYAPLFGRKDVELLAIYSHMIDAGLYLPDYPLGHIIAFQLDQKLAQGRFGDEYERMTRFGRVTPQAWMRNAVGTGISAEALLQAADAALQRKKAAGGK